MAVPTDGVVSAECKADCRQARFRCCVYATRADVAAGFGLPEGPLKLQCVRMAGKEQQQQLARYFPAQCTAKLDEVQQQ